MSRHPELVERSGHPPRWALVLLALAIIAAVAVLFRWLSAVDTANRIAGNPANFSRPEAQRPEAQRPEAQRPEAQRPEAQRPEEPRLITELTQLLEAPDLEALRGRQVVLEDVPVQDVVGDHTFWVGPAAQSRIPVVLIGELMERQPEERVEVHAGDRLRIFGVVRELREVEALEEARYLTPREREELSGSALFIAAWRVVPLGR